MSDQQPQLRYGDIQFQLGGQAYKVRYGNIAWDALKRQFGVTTEGACIMAAVKQPENLLAFLRAGLSWYQPAMALEDVRNLHDEIPQDGECALADAAWAAAALALPELVKTLTGSDVPKGEPAPETKPTRKRSSKKR